MAIDHTAIAKDLRPLNLSRVAAPAAGAGGPFPPPTDLLLAAPHPSAPAAPRLPPVLSSPAADFSHAAFPGPVAGWPAVVYSHQQTLPNVFPEQAAAASCGASGDGAADEQPRSASSKKVKFLCSFGGKILPRPSDGTLRYAGGHTRIIALRKDASFQELMQKMSEAYGGPVVLKYQLPDEDLDALVTVSCPEDLENMMEEYDKVVEASPEGSAKLRVFLFSPAELDVSGIGLASDVQDTGQRYVDAVNGAAEKEAAGMNRKESSASFSSTQTSDGVPAEVLESTADGVPSAIAPPAVALSGVATSPEYRSLFPDVASDPLFSISALTTVPVNAPGSTGIASTQTLTSSMLQQPLPPCAGETYVPQAAYMDPLHDVLNPVEYIHNPSQVQYLNPQQLGTSVSFVANPQHSYVPAVHVTAAIPAAQVSSGKPALASVEPYLDDGSCGGRTAQVPVNPTYKPFQALSQLPPLPSSLLPVQNVERYGLSQVPPRGMIPVQTLKFEDCDLCQRASPHAHSDTRMQEHWGSIPTKSPTFHSFHSEEVSRSHIPLRMGHGVMPNSAAVLQIEGGITPAQLGAYGYPLAAESQKEFETFPCETENLGKKKVFHPQVFGFAGPVQASYGVYVSNTTQAWHEDILQPQQPPLAPPQYLLKQDPVFSNPIGTNITSAGDEITHNMVLPVRDAGAEFLREYTKPAEGMTGAPHLSHFQTAGLNEYRMPTAEPNVGDSAIIEGAMNGLHISPSGTSDVTEQRKAVTKPNVSAQDELKPESSPLVVGTVDNIRQNIIQPDAFLAETSVSPGKLAQLNSYKLVDLLPSSMSEVSRIHNPQLGEPNQICQVPGNLTPHSQDLELGNGPPIPHERLLQGSSAATKVPIGDWKDEASRLYTGNTFSDAYAPPTSTIAFPLPSMNTHNLNFTDVREPAPSESLFSNLEPWQIMHNSHVLPPKPRRVSSKSMLVPRDSCIEKCLENSSGSRTAAQLEEENYDQPLDSLIKNTCPDPSTTKLMEGTAEERIKQDLQAVAEGVAASVLQQSSPVPGILGFENSCVSESGKDRAPHEDNTDSQSSECHIGHRAEDVKTGQSDKPNLGFQIMEDIGHLQIIRNSDLEELRELGSGTFGTVYHGKWRGSDVAIKRINDRCFAGKQSEKERLRADFWNEACKLADLHHPNVVAFYGIVLDAPEGSVATVTEYMVNGSLRQALQRNHKSLDQRKRILIAMDVAFGMEYLHGKNIVHFDLKSDNLLVNLRDPQRPICKVGDLGLSKVKRQTLISGGVRGTLPWMAPELLSGSKNLVSEKVDVFSFGIVMWELLTGEEPYADLHYGAIIGGIVNNTLRPPVPESCDPEWRSLMERCWSSEPSERPSFMEIANKLREMAASIPLKGQAQAQNPQK